MLVKVSNMAKLQCKVLADQIEAGNPPEKLRDINGNRCGEVTHHPDFFVTEE